jgi:hypothetical protein
MPTTHAIPAANPDILVRKLDNETVFLSADGRTIHTLGEVGTFIWDHIDGRRDLGGIVVEICRVFAVSETVAAADLDALMTEMTAMGLVTLRS